MAWDVRIQWATDPMLGFEQFSLATLAGLPKKEDPRGGGVLDPQPGWVNQLCVQGISFSQDHYHVVEKDGDLIVTVWGTDEALPYAQVWRLEPKFVANERVLAGEGIEVLQPEQHLTMYLQPDDVVRRATYNDHWTSDHKYPVEVLDWSSFVVPPEIETLHGVFLTDEVWKASLEEHDTPEWTEWKT